MRLFETESLESTEQVIEFIKTNCTAYLRDNPKHLSFPLTRGIEVTNKTAMIYDYPKNRTPVATPPIVDKAINTAFKNAGFIARRDNSIFCTGDTEQADMYGTLYVIYPIGEYHFTWSPGIRDLFGRYPTLFDKGYLKLNRATYVDDPDSIRAAIGSKMHELFGNNWRENFKLEPDSWGNIITKIADYINESYDETESYVYDFMSRQDLTKLINKSGSLETNGLEEFLKDNYTQTNILSAIRSEKEIIITGSKYLAVSVGVFNEIVRDKSI